MKAAAKTSAPNRKKKLVLVRGRASQILASVHVGTVEKRRAKAALAAVSRLEAPRAAAAARKAGTSKRRFAKKADSKHAPEVTVTVK